MGGINKLIGLMMLVPLILTAQSINERHKLLSRTIGTRPEEDISHSTIAVMLPIVLVFFIVGSSLEVAAYLLFNYKVHPWKDLLSADEQNNTYTQTDTTETSTHINQVLVKEDTPAGNET